MVYVPHEPVKPEKLINTYVGLLPRFSGLHRLAARKGIEDYVDAENDTVSMKVEGRLPYRRYAFRNDRSSEIVFDQYKERKVSVTMGDHIYSALEITDEQRDFDLVNPNNMVVRQASAVGEGLHKLCADFIEAAPFPVVIGGAQYNIRRSLLEARKVMNKLRVPGRRFLIVGADFELAMLEDEKLVDASRVGDSIAEGALRDANIGRVYGFEVIRDDEIESTSAYAMVDGGYVLINGAPS